MISIYLSCIALAISVTALAASMYAIYARNKRHPHFVDFSKMQGQRNPTPITPFAGASAFRKTLGTASTPEAPDITQNLRQNLRLKFLHHEEQVDAAIQFERERNPSADLNSLMRAAIARWERDNV